MKVRASVKRMRSDTKKHTPKRCIQDRTPTCEGPKDAETRADECTTTDLKPVAVIVLTAAAPILVIFVGPFRLIEMLRALIGQPASRNTTTG